MTLVRIGLSPARSPSGEPDPGWDLDRGAQNQDPGTDSFEALTVLFHERARRRSLLLPVLEDRLVVAKLQVAVQKVVLLGELLDPPHRRLAGEVEADLVVVAFLEVGFVVGKDPMVVWE
jgi:hypothetical protein